MCLDHNQTLGSSENTLDTGQLHSVKEVVKKTKETCQSISTEHKDIHASISKFGKAIDKVVPIVFTHMHIYLLRYSLNEHFLYVCLITLSH